MSRKQGTERKVSVLTCYGKGTLCMKCALAVRDRGPWADPQPGACWDGRVRRPRVSVRLSDSACCILGQCFRASIDHNPPFFAFSSHFHFPKSIYEGNFGCGYLKERRASGLVCFVRILPQSVEHYLWVLRVPPSCVWWGLLECGLETNAVCQCRNDVHAFGFAWLQFLWVLLSCLLCET